MAGTALFCSILIAGLICYCEGLQFVATPPYVTIGQTKNVTLSCDARSNNVSFVTFMQLSKIGAGGKMSPLLEMIPGEAQPSFVDVDFSARAQATGNLDINKGVHLTALVPDPIHTDGGKYRCTMSYVDSQHGLKSTSVQGSITVLDIFTVQSGLEALQADLADVKARYCVCDDGNGGGSGHGSHKPTVAFSARVFSTQESASLTKEVVPFNMAELDTNNAFNETSSTFTVPEDGLYDIALTLTGDAYSANNSSTSQNSGAQTSFEATLKVNHVTKAAMLVRHDQTSSLTVNLKLVKGQQLRVEATSASGASVRTERFSSFSGTLLN